MRAELAERGVIGFKAFMSNSGHRRVRATPTTARSTTGWPSAARLGLLVAVHAENDALTARSLGPTARDFMDSRPVIAELEAISARSRSPPTPAARCTSSTCPPGAASALVTEARPRGVDVTCETCPHYLFLTEADVEALGAVAKCAPPVRDDDEQERLWEQRARRRGRTSSPPTTRRRSRRLKAGDVRRRRGAGSPACQSTLELLLTEGRRAPALETSRG